ncbi:unnamed protein product, partial [Didymodactylos carnosus]
ASLNACLTDYIRRSANQALKSNKNKKVINVNKTELTALKGLLKDKSIVIMKADKGSSCVVMDKEQYKRKVLELLSSGNSFRKMNDKDEKDKINTIENVVKKMEGKLNYRLNELKRAKKLSQDDCDYIKCTGSRCSVFFALPKVHKIGFLLRPIISTTNSYNYKLAKYLTSLLERTRSKPPSYIKDSFQFAKLIQQKKVNKNELMLSLDVESLFTNVDVNEAIELAIKIIMDKKKSEKNFTKLTSKDLRKLFQLAVTNTPFRFYDELFLQTGGVSMGSPLAPVLADIFMTNVEQPLQQYEHYEKIKLYLRYVDDTFILLAGKEEDAQEEALSICSSKQLLEEQCTFIEKTMIQNGYPVNLVKRKVKNTIDRYQKSQTPPSSSMATTATTTPIKLKKKTLFIPLTHYGIETIKMANKIKMMLEQIYPAAEVIFGFKKGLTLGKLFSRNFKGKDPMDIGVVYKLSCNSCSQVYYGQTKLHVMERMEQHKEGLKKVETSAAADHMINNINHIINFSQPEIVARDVNKKRREIKETLLTLQDSNAYNKISHEVMIFN